MNLTKLYGGSPAPRLSCTNGKIESGTISVWITRLIMISLQVIVALSLFQLFRNLVFSHSGAISSNIYLSILGCTLATICACLILAKYQTLIQDFYRENINLGERVGAQTLKLQKTNEEMRLEIAERRRVEKALLESESRFRTILREAVIGIALIDKKGHIIEGNPALLAMLGYSPEELQGMDFTRINHPENAESSWKNFQKLLTGHQDVCRVETRYIRKDGWIGWGRQSISLVRETGGKPQFAIALFEDITERRESEEKIHAYQEQLQSLASELSLTEERERRRLATVLHDHIAQLLVVAKAKAENLQESRLGRSLAKPMAEVRRLIEESIRHTRSLIFELSPPILYDLGFESAMDWLAEHMQQQHGLVVEVEDDGQAKDLDNEVRALLFRAVQELLFNVLKHAQVSRARVCMRRDGDHLRVAVEDNGAGFAPDKLSAPSGKMAGFGLFSIRERLNYFGGRMQIDSIPGQVTSIVLTIPLKPEKKKGIRLAKPPIAIKTIPSPVASKPSARPPVNHPVPYHAQQITTFGKGDAKIQEHSEAGTTGECARSSSG
jgi:PAS domain S-box-containing protein